MVTNEFYIIMSILDILIEKKGDKEIKTINRKKKRMYYIA